MRSATLTRRPSTDEGTFGQITTDTGFKCASLELPDRGNAHDLSCIQASTYLLEWDNSPEHGWCYHFRKVVGRDHVLLHPANLAGDVTRGYVSQLLGCVAPGADIVTFNFGAIVSAKIPPLTKQQRGVSASKQTLAALIATYKVDGIQAPFQLTII